MTARATSIESYYSRIVTPGVELKQIDQIVLYVLNHPCCTRRQIAAAHTGALNQEARVSARVKAALDRGLIVESPSPIKDEVTGAEAYPLYPIEKQSEFDFSRAYLNGRKIDHALVAGILNTKLHEGDL